jgi:hypothetical protein
MTTSRDAGMATAVTNPATSRRPTTYGLPGDWLSNCARPHARFAARSDVDRAGPCQNRFGAGDLIRRVAMHRQEDAALLEVAFVPFGFVLGDTQCADFLRTGYDLLVGFDRTGATLNSFTT